MLKHLERFHGVVVEFDFFYLSDIRNDKSKFYGCFLSTGIIYCNKKNVLADK